MGFEAMRVVVLLALVASCEDSQPPVADANVDAATSAIVCAQPLPAVEVVGADEPVSGRDCSAAPTIETPPSGCRLDLRTLRAGDLGTCGAAGSDPILLDGPTQLPIAIDLPESANDPACAPACTGVGEPLATSTFGIRIRVSWPPQGGPFSAVRVDPPWFVVAGNECEPTLCANGAPSINEFGEPLACVFTYCHELGVITDDPSPPPARLTIIPSEISNEHSNCCLAPRAN